MKYRVYLICFVEANPGAAATIKDLWPDAHYEITETQFLVVKPLNGGRTVHERIEDQLGHPVSALVVRVPAFHGRHNPELWQWLIQHQEHGE